ncbi:MAG TPA: gamma-glutamyltransferase [Gaiellaceae bacterium]|nr:gamma-glutamyltransferase [Gaiellaceae bacterium]
MIATSHVLATRAGVRIFELGGNAADAVLAAAAVLCVVEPMSTGVGGDAFALVWHDGRVAGLDAAGPAPADAAPTAPVAEAGPRSVTVPGAVAGWAELAERFGRLGLDRCLADAIDVAARGAPVAPRAASAWTAGTPCPPELGPRAPNVGDRVAFPELAATLRRIAEDGPAAVYSGAVARAIASASWLTEGDLERYAPRWVEPLRRRYRDAEVLELPPPTQGVAALEGLGLLELGSPDLASQVECVALALEDAFAYVRDGADVAFLIDDAALRRRRAARTAAVGGGTDDTVYLCAVDGDGLAVSFIQSLYQSFGSGVVAPETGIVLQNRGACFAVDGAVTPGRRPYHTIIPGLLLRGTELLGLFGVVGGFMQAQAHVQLVSGLVDEGLDPQAALDRPRFRLEGGAVRLEEGLWDRADELQRLGHRVERATEPLQFGAGQAIVRRGGVLYGGTDARADGAVGVA